MNTPTQHVTPGTLRTVPAGDTNLLRRAPENPLLEPTKRWWESVAVFNPGAVETPDGVIHILYRAIGRDGISRLGHARSRDGVTIEDRSTEPVLEPDPNDEYDDRGVEDPRITLLDGRYIITYAALSSYVAFSLPPPSPQSSSPDRIRVGYAWTTDFHTYVRGGVLLPDMNNKDAVLFPERIHGRYAVLHRLPPDIWIAYSDDLRSWTDHHVILRTRPGSWDERKLGAGPPPLRIDEGWLLLYHASDHHNVYRCGFALLDGQDPSIVRARMSSFALEPREPYEVGGKSVDRVVFPEGMIRRGDELLVYYGGADRTVAVAKGSLREILASLQ